MRGSGILLRRAPQGWYLWHREREARVQLVRAGLVRRDSALFNPRGPFFPTRAHALDRAQDLIERAEFSFQERRPARLRRSKGGEWISVCGRFSFSRQKDGTWRVGEEGKRRQEFRSLREAGLWVEEIQRLARERVRTE